ncbi:hypothetical protein GOEFS_110_00590 [Gordonia effusa NBRC 100432]|uniref:Uncharacterized protein n=1 Tax=Gordonia effusa NBRC 100432 TaxID=1077974 RepID=H0R5H9_9ACTN|nr:hypothetical protein [Gordonia effusa]GAB20330.1 hypothetical protein GOEFS_110_00590 [Gordonia effusa NBRC 100432]
MIIEPGKLLRFTDKNGLGMTYMVHAVRHFPIDFVELEPCSGGPRKTMPISILEKLAQSG